MAANIAQEAMIYELENCSTRSYAAISERVKRTVYEKLMESEAAHEAA